MLVIGITYWAQTYCGQITHADILPNIGSLITGEDVICIVESHKSTTEIFAPIGGRVFEINNSIINNSDLINEDCYGKGWLLKLSNYPVSDFSNLENAKRYEETISSFFRKGS